jgi:hypothetical protein
MIFTILTVVVWNHGVEYKKLESKIKLHMLGHLQIRICGYPFFVGYLNKHFAYISHHKQFIERKMPYFLKAAFAKNFVSYHRFDYPQNMYAGRKHR